MRGFRGKAHRCCGPASGCGDISAAGVRRFKIDRRHRGVAGRKINLMALSLEHLRLTVQAENALSSCLIA
jgi:hypothetical protein